MVKGGRNPKSRGTRHKYKSSPGNLGGPARPPGHMKHYLQAVSYPARKNGLIQWAKDTGMPTDVVRVLRHLPDREYLSPDEVVQAAEERYGG